MVFIFDFSRKNYNLKKNIFCNIENLVIVTPSEWLKKLVKQSILKEYRVNTIYNGVNTAVFRYRKESDIVKLFWVVGLILTMAGIFFGVWL